MLFLAYLLLGCEPVEEEVVDVEEDGLRFTFPLLERDLFTPPVIGVDHDPDVYEGAYQVVCTNFEGASFPYCYDEHSGTDYMLVGGFETMDAGSATILAAASGVVTFVEDGNYDRCHADGTTFQNTCDGFSSVGNGVKIEHEDGSEARYWHMMTDSAMVLVGDEVLRGDALGLVGSAGNSSGPHLHFGFVGPDDEVIDPYAGEFSQEESFWCEQEGIGGLPGDCL